MVLKAVRTQRREGRNAVIRFEIKGHPDKPVKEFSTGDYKSGQDILAAFKAWAAQFGTVELEK